MRFIIHNAAKKVIYFGKDILLRILLKSQILIGLISENEAIFQYTYRMATWGSLQDERYFSGTGSMQHIVKPYTDFIEDYIKQNQITSVVDLGCGDFRASRMINFGEADYIGIDLVKDLVDYNSQKYQSTKIKFLHQDIINEALPKADLCLVKQVLQHLSDKDILNILNKMSNYRHVLIMDGLYQHQVQINRDIRTGFNRNTGVYLEQPPFNCKIHTLLQYDETIYGKSFRLIKLLNVSE